MSIRTYCWFLVGCYCDQQWSIAISLDLSQLWVYRAAGIRSADSWLDHCFTYRGCSYTSDWLHDILTVWSTRQLPLHEYRFMVLDMIYLILPRGLSPELFISRRSNPSLTLLLGNLSCKGSFWSHPQGLGPTYDFAIYVYLKLEDLLVIDAHILLSHEGHLEHNVISTTLSYVS